MSKNKKADAALQRLEQRRAEATRCAAGANLLGYSFVIHPDGQYGLLDDEGDAPSIDGRNSVGAVALDMLRDWLVECARCREQNTARRHEFLADRLSDTRAAAAALQSEGADAS